MGMSPKLRPAVPAHLELFVDPQRCIGCRACVEACGECPSHGGQSMIHLDEIARADTVQTTPTVCMHCEDPACANACPADAIHQGPDGIVHTAMVERCIGCSNCVVACPFGVPKYDSTRDLMMKCDHCYDRTSIGLRPMCATVCPSGALFFGTVEEIAAQRGMVRTREFQFGGEVVRTKVNLMLPRQEGRLVVGADPGRSKTRAEECMEEAIV